MRAMNAWRSILRRRSKVRGCESAALISSSCVCSPRVWRTTSTAGRPRQPPAQRGAGRVPNRPRGADQLPTARRRPSRDGTGHRRSADPTRSRSLGRRGTRDVQRRDRRHPVSCPTPPPRPTSAGCLLNSAPATERSLWCWPTSPAWYRRGVVVTLLAMSPTRRAPRPPCWCDTPVRGRVAGAVQVAMGDHARRWSVVGGRCGAGAGAAGTVMVMFPCPSGGQ